MAELNTLADETDEQRNAREAQQRDNSSRMILKLAPDLLHHVRAIAVGSPESGETLREWNAPMRITAADAADAVFAQLVDWRTYWDDQFDIDRGRVFVAGRTGHITTPDPWTRRTGEVQGFASGTSPELAQILTRVQTRILLDRADDIIGHTAAATYQGDIIQMLGSLSAQFPLSAPIDYDAIDNTVTSKAEYLTDDESVLAEIRFLMIKPYLLPSEAAILVRKSKRSLNRWIRDGLMTYSHEGKRYVRLEEVRSWIAEHATSSD